MAKIIAETTISDFTVTIEPNDDDREGVQCWVAACGGKHMSSLAVVEDLGGVEHCDGSDRLGKAVPNFIVDRIRAFAERHGY